MSGATADVTAGGTADGLPIKQGAINGAIAWIVGLVVVFVLMQLAGGVFSLIASNAPIGGASLGYIMLHGFGAIGFGGTTWLVLTLLPAVLLLGLGYYTASNAAGGSSGFLQGASIAVGYIALLILSLVYVMVRVGSGTGTVTFDPGSLVIILLLAGVLFPVVFGGLGGWIADKQGA